MSCCSPISLRCIGATLFRYRVETTVVAPGRPVDGSFQFHFKSAVQGRIHRPEGEWAGADRKHIMELEMEPPAIQATMSSAVNAFVNSVLTPGQPQDLSAIGGRLIGLVTVRSKAL